MKKSFAPSESRLLLRNKKFPRTNFVRAWRLYLAGSVAAFEAGSLQLFQVVLGHERSNHVPMTRADLYGDAADRTTQWGESGERETEGDPLAARRSADGEHSP